MIISDTQKGGTLSWNMMLSQKYMRPFMNNQSIINLDLFGSSSTKL